ncbi:hypothetical protein NDU88_006312, partial [Pleurodeles waltl]
MTTSGPPAPRSRGITRNSGFGNTGSGENVLEGKQPAPGNFAALGQTYKAKNGAKQTGEKEEVVTIPRMFKALHNSAPTGGSTTIKDSDTGPIRGAAELAGDGDSTGPGCLVSSDSGGSLQVKTNVASRSLDVHQTVSCCDRVSPIVGTAPAGQELLRSHVAMGTLSPRGRHSEVASTTSDDEVKADWPAGGQRPGIPQEEEANEEAANEEEGAAIENGGATSEEKGGGNGGNGLAAASEGEIDLLLYAPGSQSNVGLAQEVVTGAGYCEQVAAAVCLLPSTDPSTPACTLEAIRDYRQGRVDLLAQGEVGENFFSLSDQSQDSDEDGTCPSIDSETCDSSTAPLTPISVLRGTTVKRQSKQTETITSQHKQTQRDSKKARVATKQIQVAISKVAKTCSEIGERIVAIECRADALESDLGAVTKQAAMHESQLSDIQWKVEDFENRQRRNNLCLIGIKEGVEGQDSRAFIIRLLKAAFPEQTGWDWEKKIQRAHRFPL